MFKKIFVVLIFSLISFSVLAGPPIKVDGMNVYREGSWLDLDVELGYGRVERDNLFVFKTRVGHLYVREPYFLSVGPAIYLFTGKNARYGVQSEFYIGGCDLSFAVGLYSNIKNDIIASVGAGWALLSFETQFRNKERSGNEKLYLFKFKLPVGVVSSIW